MQLQQHPETDEPSDLAEARYGNEPVRVIWGNADVYQASADNIARWKAGAERFKALRHQLNMEGVVISGSHEHLPCSAQELGELQAMFLGEKPAVFMNKLCARNVSLLEAEGFHLGNV